MTTSIQIITAVILSTAFIAIVATITAYMVKKAIVDIKTDGSVDDEPVCVEDDLKEYFYLYADTESQVYKHYPYRAGWTRVLAPNREAADGAFRAYHQDYFPGMLSCACVYEGDLFRNTSIFNTGNYGEYEHETITVSRLTITKKGE